MSRIGIMLLILFGFFAIACEQKQQPPSLAEAILQGEHRLRKMVEHTGVNSKISGGFFFFVGDISGSTTTQANMKFAWEMNDGTFAISSLPLEKIRVKLDESTTTPTIRFRWRPWSNVRGSPGVQTLMDHYVLYALLTVREEDWPIRINLPLSQ